MKERPIMFGTQLIPKILDLSKTQTRRVIKPSNSDVGVGKVDWSKFCWDGTAIHTDTCFEPNCNHSHKHQAPMPFADGKPETGQYLHVPYNWQDDMTIFRVYPKWQVGDRLWVRETHQIIGTMTLSHRGLGRRIKEAGVRYKDGTKLDFACPLDVEANPAKWRPSIHMPRWASRITLEITGIRAERLQEITEEDAKAEGCSARDEPFDLIKSFNSSPSAKGHFEKLWNSLNPKYSWEANPFVWVISFKKL